MKKKSLSVKKWWDTCHLKISDPKYGFFLSGYKGENIWRRLNISDRIFEGQTVLNIGVGKGYCTQALVYNKCHVNVLDISDVALKRVASIVEKTWKVGQMEDFPSNYFDLAISHLVTQHMSNEDLRWQISRVLRGLKKDGIFAVQFMDRLDRSRERLNQSPETQKKGGVARSLVEMIQIVKSLGGEIVWAKNTDVFPDRNAAWYAIHIVHPNGGRSNTLVANALLQEAQDFYQLKKMKEAKEVCYEALKFDACLVKAFFILGMISADESDEVAAFSHFNKALSLINNTFEKDFQDIYMEASLYKRIKNYEKSIILFESLLNSKMVLENNFLGGIYFHLGEIFMEKGNMNKALSFLKKCIGLNPHHKKASEYLKNGVVTIKEKKDNPYRVNKLAYHSNIINNLRSGQNNTLVQVHLMPTNLCNQRCDFCSYRMPENKNSACFDTTRYIPLKNLEKLIEDMKEIGVKAIEVTGGGEPLAYKHKYRMFELLFKYGFDVGLVTNGTLLDDHLADLLADNLMWMRISIDAGSAETYSKLRGAPDNHFQKALNALRMIRDRHPKHPEFRLGAGYVMANGNELDVYEICRLAKEFGADNIRLSMTFSDKHMEYFKDHDKVKEGIRLSEKAVKELSDDNFQIINLIPERWENILEAKNDYSYCYIKDVLCVIEGEGNVYTCCTFTGSGKGRLGNFLGHKEGFKGVWKDSQTFRNELDPRKYCKVTCLYARRNLEITKIVHSPKVKVSNQRPVHVNFI